MGTKTLLVEDNAVNAEMLTRRLVRRGCQEYETKPVELERLLEKMHSLLRAAKQP